jgi:uncharacterized protein YukE
MIVLTLEEQERRAYVEGKTELAAVLARADDAEAALDEVDRLKKEIEELQAENERLRDSFAIATRNWRTEMSRTQDAMQQAKDALLHALRVAEQEGLPAALVKQIDTLTAKAETLQYKLRAKSK